MAHQDKVGAVQEALTPASPLPVLLPVVSLPSDSESSLSDCVGSVPSPMSNDGNPDVSPSPLQSPSHPLPISHSLDSELGVEWSNDMSCPVKFLKSDSPSCPSPWRHALRGSLLPLPVLLFLFPRPLTVSPVSLVPLSLLL